MNVLLVCFISGASFLLSSLLFFHPFQQNVRANRWLGFFVFILGCAFINSYLILTEMQHSNSFLFKCLCSLQFLLAPCLYISIHYFVKPAKTFQQADWYHFILFAIYASIDCIWNEKSESISTVSLFTINENVSFLVRDVLPFIVIFYLIKSYTLLVRHQTNLKQISSDINQINLDWLIQLLFILSITIIIWMNDALFGLPLLSQFTNFVYAGSIFFIGHYAIKQKNIFAFKDKDVEEISTLLEFDYTKPAIIANLVEAFNGVNAPINISETALENPKNRRLSAEQVAALSAQLNSLMEQDKLFLENDLNLPTVAKKLGISIHETSFLINETTKDNFYNFINKYRVEEAKRLLVSTKIEELNILGIAFESGFNSKTTFNTTFKKLVGISPSQYSKQQKNQQK